MTHSRHGAHETKSTVAATRWCNRCRSYTLHNFSDGRKGNCQPCADVAAAKRAAAPAVTPAAQQSGLQFEEKP